MKRQVSCDPIIHDIQNRQTHSDGKLIWGCHGRGQGNWRIRHCKYWCLF